MRYFALTLIFLLVSQEILAQQPIEIPKGKPGTLKTSMKQIANKKGVKTEVEVGTFLVPENRKQPTEQVIEIPFYRLKSTAKKPAAPIFLLAGGPGSSWIDNFRNEENFDEVQFYRTIADVILFDQRGAGHARPKLRSHESTQYPLLKPLDPNSVAEALQELSSKCRARLIDAGIDVTAYNTEESAADVNDLRSALGYKRITLLGGSYGSHLALTIMRLFPESVERAVLYGIEGTDHTWDDPAGYLATLERIAKTAESSDELGPHIPEGGLLSTLQTVIDRLEAQPEKVSFQQGGRKVTVLVDAFLVRRLVGHQAGRKSRLNFWPEFILDLHEGNYAQIARGAYALRSLRLDDPMHYMMDCSSGISESRRARYDANANKRLLGNINFEYESLTDVWKMPDMGDDFRSEFECDIPTLIIHGTWDTSTPIENAREVASMLSNSQLVEVITGTHGALYNLYAHWDPAHDKIGAFLNGNSEDFPKRIKLTNIKFKARTVHGADGK